MTASPLAGIRVLDLTTIVVGPVCTLRLADYGAEVIKVEPPDGDLMRALGGPSPTGRHAASYLQLNRTKRSLGLDLKHPEAAAIVERLLDRCDIVVANMRPEALARLGLDGGSVRTRRPGLVHCTITGFGPGGPYRGLPAYDLIVQGAAGIGGLFAIRDGVPNYVPFVLCDHVVGEIAAGAILAALVARGRTGSGATIEVPMFETVAAFVLQEHMAGRAFEPSIGPAGDRRLLSSHNRPVRTADGWISFTANTDAQARAFLEAIGRQDLFGDPRFVTVADRFRHIDDWLELRLAVMPTRTTADWLDIMRGLDLPAMPCHSLESLLQDPHLEAVGLFGLQPHPTEGQVRLTRPTILFDGAARQAGEPALPIGWHSRGVLREAGFAEAAVDRFVSDGVVVDGLPRPAS